MDLSQLKFLGEIAGIGGIALGVVVLVLRPLIGTIAGLPKDARASPVKLIAIGCFVIGALGIAAWTIGSQSSGSQVSTRGAQSPGVISGGDATINYGASPQTHTGSPPANTPNGSAPSGTVRTEGNQSPGLISGGKVGVEYSPVPPAGSSPSGTK
ncbi:MAG TPA: hypothetical protein VKF83_12520 [Stellaceae bacterium]|nr:hypothetical protein [Stellaceae bacterium]